VPEHWITSYDAGAGDSSDTWTWAYGLRTLPTAAQATNQFMPGKNVIYYSMLKESNGWADGFVTYTLNYLTQNDTDWAQDDTSLTTIKNPRVTSQQKVVYNYNYSSSKTIRTGFTYAAISDYNGNTKEIREYDFAGALRRRTNFNYLHEANSTCVTFHIHDRVTDTLRRIER
jgi:hypothetical protein